MSYTAAQPGGTRGRTTVAEIEQPPTPTDEFEDVERLKLDLRNPRAPDEQFASEDEILEYLLDFVDLDELIQSTSAQGGSIMNR